MGAGLESGVTFHLLLPPTPRFEGAGNSWRFCRNGFVAEGKLDVDFQDFIERVKAANPIEDIIELTGGAEFRLRRRAGGRYLQGETHDSLKVNVEEGYYVWNRTGERGDVFNWLEARKKMDFWSALQWLADRAKLDMPARFAPSEQSQEKRLAARVREETWAVAQRLMACWLWKDEDALGYVRSRGWSDETIREAGLGFSGRASSAAFGDMRGEFNLHSIDPESPQAVCVLGFKGDVRGWGQHWGISVREDWISWGSISGMMGRTRLVYPHWYGGRLVYISGRNIFGAEEYQREGEPVKVVKSWNPYKELAGPRQPFYNHAYGRKADECVVVEGPGDGVSLAEWKIPAVATLGTSLKDADMAGTMADLRERHKDFYLGMDRDKAGIEALEGNRNDPWPLAKVFGPMGRIIYWPEQTLEGGKKVKDANDYLVWLKREENRVTAGDGLQDGQNGKEGKDTTGEAVRELLDNAPPFAVMVAHWAGTQRGTAGDDATLFAFQLIAQMPKLMQSRYRDELARRMHLGISQYNNLLKTAASESTKATREAEEVVETLGGYIDGWLVEYMWDEEEGVAKFAFRDPEGKVDVADQLDLEGKRYIPKTPNSLIILKAVLFPSKLGQLKSTRELVAIVESFIHRYYLLDDKFFGRMAAYYVLLTWLHDSFNAIPYLRATGDYGSGKSELMKRIGHVCYRMMSTGGAGTAASVFRALDEFRGTAFMDEMDLADGGDMANDLIKILNMGAMKGTPVWRLSDVILADGTRAYENKVYNIFGPKLIAMRGDFKDKAVSSRCLTVQLMAKESMELKRAGVVLHLNQEFYDQALQIRNLLLRWRLAKWQPEIAVTEDLMDLAVPARLNQVAMPLKAIARDDPELMRDVTSFVRSLNDELILERSMGLDARVMDALVAIREQPKYMPFLNKGFFEGWGEIYYAYTKYITKVVNELMDEMNVAEDEGEDDDGKKRKRRGTTSQTVGKIARQTLQLPSKRMAAGYVVIYNEDKFAALKLKYGLGGSGDQGLAADENG